MKCRLFKLVTELISVTIIAKFIPSHPEVAVIVAADFHYVELKAVLPKFPKFINFPETTIGPGLL